MKKILFTLSAVSLLLGSCGGGDEKNGEIHEGKGGVYYGGVFRTNSPEGFKSLYPLNITDLTSSHIASHVYEGLVKLNQSDLSVVLPCIADDWAQNEDATVWTFNLRKGLKFQDDECFQNGKGREVTVQDLKYCFDRLCSASPENQNYNITFKGRVQGADEFFQSTLDKKPLAGGVSGIKVLDDHTLQISLKYPFSGFLNILAMPGCWIYPHEAVEKYGSELRVHAVGTGAFKMSANGVKENEFVVLERNKNYWGVDEFGNQLPYLNGVKYSFIKDKKSEILDFRKGNLDMIFRLPIDQIPLILDEFNNAKEGNAHFDMQMVPAMSIFYYGFQNQGVLFSNKALRQAFNYAIDREKLVTHVLQGEGIPAMHGVIPPSFKNYDINSVKGFVYNPDTAKILLAKAGYPNGKGFPKLSLQINSGSGDRNIQTAEAIKYMLKENLNIDIDINVLQFAEHMENYETGKSDFWKINWVADYPQPETFLVCFYGKLVPEKMNDRSYINSVRYKNAKFDSLFEAALRENDTQKRYEIYKKADQTLIDDAACMPLFYDENYRLIQLYVKNFDANAMEFRDLTKVYFIPKDEVKKK